MKRIQTQTHRDGGNHLRVFIGRVNCRGEWRREGEQQIVKDKLNFKKSRRANGYGIRVYTKGVTHIRISHLTS